MGKSTKRQNQANDASARPEKRRRHREPEPETDPESERGHSSSPVPAKKAPGRPGKNATGPLNKDHLKKTRAYLESSRPTVQKDDLDKYVGPTAPPLNETWTQEDEDAMMADWDASPEKRVYASMKVQDGSIPTMWKVCLRVFRCSPLAFISPIQGLRYQPVGPSQPGLWSREFCTRLTALIAYPVWQGRLTRLAMVLQYAVICRTDDRRPWIPRPSCPALTNLRQSMQQSEGSELSKSVHRMHKEARALAIQGGHQPSTLSHLLLAIHRTVKGWTFDKNPEPVTSSSGFQVYSVTVHDLRVVAAAINDSIDCSVDEAYETFKTAKGSGLEIPKPSQLRDLYERASRHQLRQIAMALREVDEDDGQEGEGEDEEMAGPQPESESEPESSGSDMELEDQPVPEDESESESRPEDEADPSSESDSGPNDELLMEIDDEAPPGDETELDDAPPSVPPAPLQPVRPVRRRLALPSPQATAPNASTPMSSHDMQDVMKAVNDLKEELYEVKRERDGMKRERDGMKREREESKKERHELKKERDELKKERDEMKSSLESFRLEMAESFRLEMANVQERLGRQEAAIKALTEAKTSQNQAPDNLEKEVATTAKATETPREEVRASGSPLPSTERGVEWRGTNLHILNAPKDWEPPQNCPKQPAKDDLWLSHRGLMMNRHPFRGALDNPGQSALERAMQFYGDGKDGH